ncbi:hypothetical protein FKW77_000670 [Venturia effusa]|uniref:FAD-binding domain-containing protein n=1 Tax=Venturia effusa TaxID=50376 RepID=A0A517LM96_9PEZI|nr:hypothetical protein FKW77_000670 [Venturia effusa]
MLYEDESAPVSINFPSGGVECWCDSYMFAEWDKQGNKFYPFSSDGSSRPVYKSSFNILAIKNKASEEETTWINFRNGINDPSLIVKIQTQDDAKTGLSSVHRARFLEALAARIPAERFHFNKRLVELESGTTAALLLRFDDGTTEEVDALIGCDGIRSKCRQLMLQRQSVSEDLLFTNKYVYRGLVAMERARSVLGDKLSENSQMYLGPGGHVLTYPIEGGDVLNVVAFRDKCDRALEDVDLWALFDMRPIESYYKGFIALLGDAAHASTPHQGAGAGQALEDALVLASLLDDESVRCVSDIPAALKAYSQTQKDRSQKAVATSRAVGDTYACRGPAGSDIEGIRAELLQQFQ